MIGAVDNDGVGVGDVQSRFDDRRADQHVHMLVDEVVHHDLQLALLHLAVSDRDLGFGHQRAQMARHVVDVLDPVVDEEHLAAAVELAQNRPRG